MASLFSPALRPALRALAVSFVPEIAAASEREWDTLEATIARALAARPRAVERQLLALVRLLEALSLLRYATRLARLGPERLTRLLERLARSRVLLFRRGIWGLRTLVMLGWYTQPSVLAALGYRANAAGWARAEAAAS